MPALTEYICPLCSEEFSTVTEATGEHGCTGSITPPRSSVVPSELGYAAVNRYPGNCADCNAYVGAEAGRLGRRPEGTGRWVVTCGRDCTVAMTPATIPDGTYTVSAYSYRVRENSNGVQVVRHLDTGREIPLTRENQRLVRERIAAQHPGVSVPSPFIGVSTDATVERTPTPDNPGVADGHYALGNGHQYRIRPLRRGSSYRRAQVRRGGYGGWVTCNLAVAVAAIRAEGERTATVRFGELTGRCGVCGRTLTDPESIARSIGPTCLSRRGWS